MKGLYLFCIFIFCGCGTHTLYIVRHAEKDKVPANDPPLTEAGVKRAQVLADSLRGKEIRYVFSTHTLRTLSTAKPAADNFGLPVLEYATDTLAMFQDRLTKLKRNALVVGHSNTLPAMLDYWGLAHPFGAEISVLDYDNWIEVKVKRSCFGKARYSLRLGNYGAVSP